MNTSTSSSTLDSRDLALLAALTFFWGINWPIMKYGVLEFPPLTFRFISMVGGLFCLGLVAHWQGASLKVPRQYAGDVFRLALPNMVVWHIFAISGVALLTSGRAGILGYTMPVFALLASWWLERRRPGGLQFLGVGLALTATLLLISSEFSKMAGAPLGVIFMLLAAAGWGLGTVMLRQAVLPVATITLTFWMLLIATIVMGVGAVALEQAQWRWPHTGEWWSIAFNSAVVFGFCHTIWFMLARKLSPVASALSVMLIPVIGVFSGAWALNEALYWQDFAAIALVCASMAVLLIKKSA